MLIESIPKSGSTQIQASETSIPPKNPAALIGQGAEQQAPTPDFSMTNKIAADLQKNIKALNNVDLGFSVHKSSGKIMVTVTDDETGRVIREIPSSEMLNLAARLEEMMGLIFDRKI